MPLTLECSVESIASFICFVLCFLFSESGKIRDISVAAGVNLKFGYMRLSFFYFRFSFFYNIGFMLTANLWNI